MTPTTRDPFFAGLVDEEVVLPRTGGRLRLPLRYDELSTFSALFAAPAHAVQAVLPSAALTPREVAPGQVAVALTAYDYRRSDLAPYQELGVLVSTTFDPGLGQEVVAGLYCLTLPVTSEEALVAGVAGWGFPKFLADIAIEESDARCRCQASVDGQLIVSFEVGAVPVADQLDRRELPMFTVQGNELLHIPVVSEGRRGQRDDGEGARLLLGEHPRADLIRQLALGPVIGQSRSVEVKAVLPAADRRFPLSVAGASA
jgi:hypothetical protein